MTLPKAATIALTLGLFHPALAAGDKVSDFARPENPTFSIHPKLPPFTYRITVDERPNAPMEVHIEFFGGPNGFIPQTFELWTIREHKIETIDLNFDGYKDIRVVADIGNRGDVIYECWLYDSERQRFVSAPDFSMIDEIDYKARLLISRSSGGVAYWDESTYRLRNGIPEIVREVKTDYARYIRDIIPSRYSDETIVRITKLYRKGRLVRTFYSRHIL